MQYTVYTCSQMFEIITIFVMFLEEVSYSHQVCIKKIQ